MPVHPLRPSGDPSYDGQPHMPGRWFKLTLVAAFALLGGWFAFSAYSRSRDAEAVPALPGAVEQPLAVGPAAAPDVDPAPAAPKSPPTGGTSGNAPSAAPGGLAGGKKV